MRNLTGYIDVTDGAGDTEAVGMALGAHAQMQRHTETQRSAGPLLV